MYWALYLGALGCLPSALPPEVFKLTQSSTFSTSCSGHAPCRILAIQTKELQLFALRNFLHERVLLNLWIIRTYNTTSQSSTLFFVVHFQRIFANTWFRHCMFRLKLLKFSWLNNNLHHHVLPTVVKFYFLGGLWFNNYRRCLSVVNILSSLLNHLLIKNKKKNKLKVHTKDRSDNNIENIVGRWTNRLL